MEHEHGHDHDHRDRRRQFATDEKPANSTDFLSRIVLPFLPLSSNVAQCPSDVGMVEAMQATANPESGIGQEIARRMVEQGITPTELSRETKLTVRQISRITGGGTKRPRNDTLKKIADALGCSPFDLDRSGEGQHGNHRGKDHQG